MTTGLGSVITVSVTGLRWCEKLSLWLKYNDMQLTPHRHKLQSSALMKIKGRNEIFWKSNTLSMNTYNNSKLISKMQLNGTIVRLWCSDGNEWNLWTLITPPHQNHFTALFPGSPKSAGARRELLDFMVQEAETPTIRLGATPSGVTSAYIPHPPFFTDQMPFLPPNQQCQSTEGN